jgi:hypothetical protein
LRRARAWAMHRSARIPLRVRLATLPRHPRKGSLQAALQARMVVQCRRLHPAQAAILERG